MSTTSPAADPEVTGAQTAEKDEENIAQVPCFFRYFAVIVRIWSFLTVVALGVSTWWLMTHRDDYPYTSWYTMSAVIVVGILELMWVLNLCAFCRDEGGLCCTCWRLCVWIDNWRKTIIYVLLAIPEFAVDKPAPVPFIDGSLIVLLGILYLFKTCESCRCCQDDKYSGSRSRGKAKAPDGVATAPQRPTDVKDESKDVDDNAGLIKSSDGQQ